MSIIFISYFILNSNLRWESKHVSFITVVSEHLVVFQVAKLSDSLGKFLVCSVVAALTDLPHQKRIVLEFTD